MVFWLFLWSFSRLWKVVQDAWGSLWAKLTEMCCGWAVSWERLCFSDFCSSLLSLLSFLENAVLFLAWRVDIRLPESGISEVRAACGQRISFAMWVLTNPCQSRKQTAVWSIFTNSRKLIPELTVEILRNNSVYLGFHWKFRSYCSGAWRSRWLGQAYGLQRSRAVSQEGSLLCHANTTSQSRLALASCLCWDRHCSAAGRLP